MNCESTSGIETISRLDPAFTWSLESVNFFHYIVHSHGQTAEIFSLSPTRPLSTMGQNQILTFFKGHAHVGGILTIYKL